MIRTKSVYSPINRSKNGLRILVSRFRGRFLPSSRYDLWMPNLAPSERLLRDGQSQKSTWAEFSRQYRVELFADGGIDNHNQLIKNHGQKFTLRLLNKLAVGRPVTLMCLCPEKQALCHLLRSRLLRAK